MKLYEIVLIGLLTAILLLQIYNMRPLREGFQAVTGKVVSGPENNPNTCIIMLAVKEQLEINLKKASAAGTKDEAERTEQSIAAINEELANYKCN